MARALVREAVLEHLTTLPHVAPERWCRVEMTPSFYRSGQLLLRSCRELREMNLAVGLCRMLLRRALYEPEGENGESDETTTTISPIPTLEFKASGVSLHWSGARFKKGCSLRRHTSEIAHWLAYYEKRVAGLLAVIRERRASLEKLREKYSRVSATAFLFAPAYQADLAFWCHLCGWNVEYIRKQVRLREADREIVALGDALRARLNLNLNRLN